jgi:hypothetical protein
MRLSSLGINKELPTVAVLGAGASRGASCVRKVGIAPPVDADFFVQAQRMPSSELLKRDHELFAFIRAEFGPSDPPTLEVFFTQIAAVDRFHHEFNIKGRVSARFSAHLGTLRSLIPRVFRVALGDCDCFWHERIVTALRTGDAVLSFNYDTLFDRALRSVGGKRWLPEVGYGFDMASGSDLWSPPPRPGPAVKRPILLLKPHGSLNWHIGEDGQGVSMVDEYAPTTTGSIVPPTLDKTAVGQWPWSEVWRAARRVLGSARMLVVIGYSVPATDQLSQALLRADVNKLSALVVVNPDPEARRRVIDVMSSALESTASVVELQTIEEFASYLPPGPNESPPVDPLAELAKLHRQMRLNLRELAQAQGQLEESHGSLEEEQRELKSTVEEMETTVEDLSSCADEVQRLTDEVREIDARIDSILG